jgi:DNA-binding NtrC family response regulator
MPIRNVVIAQHDSKSAQALASMLDRQFHSVRLARSLEEVKSAIPRLRVELAVVDLEMVSLAEVENLSREFHVPIICTHRVPDEEMWAAALSAGAIDCCQNGDVDSILSAMDELGRAQAA